MKVLVTGGAGFIGSHVVDALRTQGADVIVIDSLDPGVYHAPPTYLRSDVDYCFTDLRQWRPDARFDDVEGIVHLAALGGVSRAGKEPENVVGANAGGTARLADVARRWPRLRSIVIAGSFSVYGSNYVYKCPNCGAERDGNRSIEALERGDFEVRCMQCGAVTNVLPITNAATPNPLETYGASKYMQELCFRGFTHCPVQILRFSSVYGPRLRLDDGEATIIAKLAGWIRAGRQPSLYEDGGQIRDWVFVGDVVQTALTLLCSDRPSSLVNVCSGTPTTLLEACVTISKVLNRDVEPQVVGGFRPGDMRHCLGDATAMEQLLGRAAVPFTDGAGAAFADSQP